MLIKQNAFNHRQATLYQGLLAQLSKSIQKNEMEFIDKNGIAQWLEY